MTTDKIGAFYVAGKKSYCGQCHLDIVKGEPYIEPWWSYGRIHLNCFEITAERHREQFEKNIKDIRSQIIQAKQELERKAAGKGD